MIRSLLLCALPWTVWAASHPAPSPTPIPSYHEAVAGDAEAQRAVGRYYLHLYVSSGIKQHFEDGLSWLRKSARQSHFEAMSDLVRARLDCKVEDRDVAEAHEWLQRLHERGRVETGYAGRLAQLYASDALGAPDDRKAYFFCLLQRMTGLLSHDVGTLQARLRKTLKPAEIAQAEKDAYDWWEDRNKPAKPVVVPGRSSGGAKKDGDKSGDGAKDDGAVDTSEKAQELAAKNRQENERRVKPLGKEGKYILPGVDDLEKRKK